MKNDKTVKIIARQMLLKTILIFIVYIGLFFAALIGGQLLFSTIIWQGDELIYRFANWVNTWSEAIFLIYLIAGAIVIFTLFFRKPFKYLDEIVDATQVLFDDDDRLVTLSAPLKDVENRMNQTKLDNINNQRIAKEAEQRKNDLVTYLAHDLKTPITSVIGYLTLLRDEPQISEDMMARYTDISLEKAQRLDELINEFFDITRFNISHITLEKRQINLSLMLNQLLFEFQPMLKEKSLTCDLDAPGEILISCDPDKIQRVFDNLLRNAVNYSFENSEVSISVREAEGNAIIVFSNHGYTISEEKLERIFDQFYRLDSSRSSQSGGAGLGLAIAREIINTHGGSITAKSADNTIIFEILIPLS